MSYRGVALQPRLLDRVRHRISAESHALPHSAPRARLDPNHAELGQALWHADLL